MNELKRSKRRGRSLLVAGAGVAMSAVGMGCGVHGVYGVYGVGVCELADGGPCVGPQDSGEPDAGTDGGVCTPTPCGVIINPDAGTDGGDAG